MLLNLVETLFANDLLLLDLGKDNLTILMRIRNLD